ncbi:heme o synthase [Krasilnikoviella flava]|uniref:Protoheme IX farnesyltransferase n=1 Tax=Krasilnikoviella flava TaxID=526729 RepID=A0A1T5L3Y6_9MICO|nr:heme o synthase [Krasilnikoviella flava]SKC70752.1 protoheme IX farnesyltransferase [Krasilnikoviella flava]
MSTTSTTTSHPSTPTRAKVRAERERADADRAERRAAAPGPDDASGKGWRDRVGAYVALTKPRIIELLLVTTLPTMILAQGGLPDLWLVLLTLVGGTLAAASANVFNCYLDRDIDQVMNRTKRRPLATGEITPRAALVFATVLGVVSLLWFALLVNVASAWLTFGAIAIYVVGYTMILKRRTPQNIVWGGIAGCMPVFIGWAAVTGSLSWAAVALFGVIFFWTPPHYWPLSVKFKKDYANAGVPMLPVVASDRRVAIEMVAHTVAMIACSLALVPLAGMSWFYTVVAIASGGWFLYLVIAMLRRAGHPERGKLGAMKVFHGSITYLTVLFIAVAVDVFLPF